MKLFFFKVFVYCQISRVYVAYGNLCCIIVELKPKVLLFAESRELLFFYKFSGKLQVLVSLFIFFQFH